MLERTTKQHIALLNQKLVSVDRRVKDVVGGTDSINLTLQRMEDRTQYYFAAASDSIESGLNILASAFEWGISDVVHHLELQRGQLKKIAQILEAPLETQTREIRRRAESAYRNGWTDEALQDFAEAVKKNYADFTVHQNMGNIYLEKNKLSKSQQCYEKAAKYARPHSTSYTAYALWHLARVRHLQGNNEAAYSTAKEALGLEPKLIECVYDLSRYCSLLGKQEEAVSNLRKAVEFDPGYCLRALTDEAFSGMREAIEALVSTLKSEAMQKAQEMLQDCRQWLHLAEEMGSRLATHGSSAITKELKKEVEHICRLIEKNTYLDYRHAYELALTTGRNLVGQLESLQGTVSARIVKVKEFVRQNEKSLQEGATGPGESPVVFKIIVIILELVGLGYFWLGLEPSWYRTLLCMFFGGAAAVSTILAAFHWRRERSHEDIHRTAIQKDSAELESLKKLSRDLSNLHQKVANYKQVYPEPEQIDVDDFYTDDLVVM